MITLTLSSLSLTLISSKMTKKRKNNSVIESNSISSKMTKKRKINSVTESTDAPLVDAPPVDAPPVDALSIIDPHTMSAGIKFYQEGKRLKSGSVEVNPSGLKGLKNQKFMSAGIKFYQEGKSLKSGSVEVNPSGLKGLKNQKLERKMKGVELNYQESAPKVSIKVLGDFKIYERLKYRRPFRVLFDTLFLEGYLLPEGNYAVETLQNLLGGPIIFQFTNCVFRSITKKRLGMHLTDMTTELYHCKDVIDYLRTDFDCLKDVIHEDGINETLILATGNVKLKRLIRKISAVPILYLSNKEKPKSRQGAPDFEVKDEVMPGELLFETHHEERNIMNMLKEADFKDPTVNVFIDEGIIRLMLGPHMEELFASCTDMLYKDFILREGVSRHIIDPISKLLGRQVALMSTRCASNHKKPYPSIGYVMCGHKKHPPRIDDCVMRVVETPEYGIDYVATTSETLKKRLSKIRFVTVIFCDGSKLILTESKASVDIEETTKEDTKKEYREAAVKRESFAVSKKRNLESNNYSKRRKPNNINQLRFRAYVSKRRIISKRRKLEKAAQEYKRFKAELKRGLAKSADKN